jgi:hypothetical protein
MSNATSLVITRVFREYLPNLFAVEFNKNIDAKEFPHNEMWLQAIDELDAVRIANEMVANGEIKEVTV